MLRPRKNNLNNLVRPKMLLITGSVEMEEKMMEGALEEIKKMEAKKRLFEKKERRRRRKCYFRAHWNWRRER